VLVVYYSRTGHTEAIACGLARACDADLESIQEVSALRRRGLFGYLRSGYEGTFRREVPIRAPHHDPRAYDVVLIGSPTWNSALCSPVRAYLGRYVGALPDVGFFATCEGRGADQVVQQMTEIVGKQPLATLTLRNCDLKGRFSVYLAEFWESLLSAREARPGRAERTLDAGAGPA
jgi:menaquinone-dependent protoporphyrinogen IX oxidase